MKNPLCKKIVVTGLKASALALTSVVMVSCGGNTDDSDVTERPKTLDDLVLTFEELQISLEFRRSSSSPTEATVATPETGSIDYTITNTENIEVSLGLGTPMQLAWPDTFTTLSYSYQPIDDLSGLLTLNAIGGSFIVNGAHTNLAFDTSINYGDWITHFPSTVAQGTTQWSPTYLLTFLNDGGTITSVDIIAYPQNVNRVNFFITAASTFVSLDDYAYVTSSALRTNTGSSVPVNYTQDDLTGTIADETLDTKTMFFTPVATGASNASAVLSTDFEIVFSDTNATSAGVDESGIVTYAYTQTSLTVSDTLDYDYDFTDGYDVSTLVLEGDIAGTTPGTYTLSYTSSLTDFQNNILKAGTYVIDAPGTTYDGETGTFIVRL